MSTTSKEQSNVSPCTRIPQNYYRVVHLLVVHSLLTKNMSSTRAEHKPVLLYLQGQQKVVHHQMGQSCPGAPCMLIAGLNHSLVLPRWNRAPCRRRALDRSQPPFSSPSALQQSCQMAKFAAQHSGTIVLQAQSTKNFGYSHLATMTWSSLHVGLVRRVSAALIT